MSYSLMDFDKDLDRQSDAGMSRAVQAETNRNLTNDQIDKAKEDGVRSIGSTAGGMMFSNGLSEALTVADTGKQVAETGKAVSTLASVPAATTAAASTAGTTAAATGAVGTPASAAGAAATGAAANGAASSIMAAMPGIGWAGLGLMLASSIF